MLTVKEYKKQYKDYKNQLGKIVDIKKTEFVFNYKWLRKLSFERDLELASKFYCSANV